MFINTLPCGNKYSVRLNNHTGDKYLEHVDRRLPLAEALKRSSVKTVLNLSSNLVLKLSFFTFLNI